MITSRKTRRQLRLQNSIFILLFLIIIITLGWLNIRYEYHADWTNNQRNTPSEATQQLLNTISTPIEIMAFVKKSNQALHSEIKHLVKIYQRFKEDISLKFVDPILEPDLIRELEIKTEGEIIVILNNKKERVPVATEKNLTNALQRLVRSSNRWVLFLEGHNERNAFLDSSHDFSSWVKILRNKGLNVRGYNLAENSAIPTNTGTLVIADPQQALLDGEIKIILDFLDNGGNLLWLIEPGDIAGLDGLAEYFGVEILEGTVVDPNTEMLGISDPRFTLIPEYPRNNVTRDFNAMTIFPTATALEFFGNEDWDNENFLVSLPRSWLETEDFGPELALDPAQDIAGPLIIGISLTRINPEKLIDNPEALFDLQQDEALDENSQMQQRIVIVADNDFASNAYLGQAGNLDLAMNIINWLGEDDSLINIPNNTATDLELELSKTVQVIFGFGFLIAIPGTLFLTGVFIWYRRKKH